MGKREWGKERSEGEGVGEGEGGRGRGRERECEWLEEWEDGSVEVEKGRNEERRGMPLTFCPNLLCFHHFGCV